LPGGEAGRFEFLLQSGQEVTGQFLQLEGELGDLVVVAEKHQDVGQFGNIVVQEILLDDGLVACKGEEHGPGSVGRRIRQAQRDLPMEAGPGDARGEGVEPLPRKREVGETGLPEQGRAIEDELLEVHGGSPFRHG